jgi:hypothetical protein
MKLIAASGRNINGMRDNIIIGCVISYCVTLSQGPGTADQQRICMTQGRKRGLMFRAAGKKKKKDYGRFQGDDSHGIGLGYKI